MTREEEIQKAVQSFCDKVCPCLLVGEYSFIQGAEWADANPKSPWISVEKDLPCNHEELMENKNYTKKVFVILSYNEDPSKKHVEVCCMCNKIGSYNVNWYWQNPPYYHVTYWMTIPKLEEE